MRQILNSHTLELLGYTNPEQVSSDTRADVFIATIVAGIEEQRVQFVYIKTRSSRSDLSNISIERNIATFFVVPESSGINTEDVNIAIPGGPHRLYQLDELIWARMTSAFREYVDGLTAQLIVEPYFVQPRSESATSEPDKEIVEFFASRSATYGAGTVLVLRAPAAVGKTTLLRIVVQRLLKSKDQYRAIPIFIESAHWSQLRLESVSGLWEVVRNSLMRFAPDLVMSKSLFEAALKTGNIVFIFDGLDELCGRRDVSISAVDIVDELASIARGTNARILLSTRTAYWDSEIARTWENVSKLDLAPFNRQQALSYFERRFSNDISLQKRCHALYQKLIQASQHPANPGGSRAQFANLPACVSLVADTVERINGEELQFQSAQSIAEQMLAFLCGRDRQRKTLTTPPLEQLFSFAQVAASQPLTSDSYAVELLEATGFDRSDVLRFVDHPLIRTRGQETFDFAYEFLDPFFKAYFLNCYLSGNKDIIETDALSLMSANANAKSAVLEHLLGLINSLSAEKLAATAKRTIKLDPLAGSFLLHLATALGDQEKLSHQERAHILWLASANNAAKVLDGITFVGSFQRFDLRGYTIVNCKFVDCNLTEIAVDHTTTLKNSSFEGDISFGNTGQLNLWRTVTYSDNSTIGGASVVAHFLLDSSAERNKDLLLDVFNLALGKFWHGGSPRRSIDKNNWKRGLLAHSPWIDLILDGFLRCEVMEDIEISGTEAGGYALHKSTFADVQRFMDSRQLSGKLSQAFDYCLDRI